jgi:C_GCAxxG_C_C family probable redox protein
MNHSELAVETFKQGYSCAQAVLTAYAPSLGLERSDAIRVAGGFGGGMGRMGLTCGALTGAIMVLGLGHAAQDPQDLAAKEATYARVRELVARFKAKHGRSGCRELIGCDISTPEGYQQARDEGVFVTHCRGYVRDACEILDRLLENGGLGEGSP